MWAMAAVFNRLLKPKSPNLTMLLDVRNTFIVFKSLQEGFTDGRIFCSFRYSYVWTCFAHMRLTCPAKTHRCVLRHHCNLFPESMADNILASSCPLRRGKHRRGTAVTTMATITPDTKFFSTISATVQTETHYVYSLNRPPLVPGKSSWAAACFQPSVCVWG